MHPHGEFSALSGVATGTTWKSQVTSFSTRNFSFSQRHSSGASSGTSFVGFTTTYFLTSSDTSTLLASSFIRSCSRAFSAAPPRNSPQPSAQPLFSQLILLHIFRRLCSSDHDAPPCLFVRRAGLLPACSSRCYPLTTRLLVPLLPMLVLFF